MKNQPLPGDWQPPTAITGDVIDVKNEVSALQLAAGKLRMMACPDVCREIDMTEALLNKASQNLQKALVDHRRHAVTHRCGVPNGDLGADYWYACVLMASQNFQFALAWMRKTLTWGCTKVATKRAP